MLYSHGCATLCSFVIKMSAVLRVVVYTTLSRALRVQGIYSASISNIGSAVAGTAYVVCAEHFILWLPRLQSHIDRLLSCIISTVGTRCMYFNYMYTTPSAVCLCDSIGLVSLIRLGWELRVSYITVLCVQGIPMLSPILFMPSPIFHTII